MMRIPTSDTNSLGAVIVTLILPLALFMDEPLNFADLRANN